VVCDIVVGRSVIWRFCLEGEAVRSVRIRVYVGVFFLRSSAATVGVFVTVFSVVVSVCFPGLGGNRLYLMIFGEPGFGIVVYIS